MRLRGEISGFRGPHASGHCYFALKDDKAKIEAVVWRSTVAAPEMSSPGKGWRSSPRAASRPSRAPPSYQIVIEQLEPAGIGALMALIEERKSKFAAEGLFDERASASCPSCRASSASSPRRPGAVIRDMLHGFDERFPTRVMVWPVRVQGETSAAEIAAAIRGFNALQPGGRVPRPDVLIVARGGGSLEDLWSFNEEIVVRAAAESRIPLISAVGHETDWTLIDLVADARAPTPTKAAEWAVPKIQRAGRTDRQARPAPRHRGAPHRGKRPHASEGGRARPAAPREPAGAAAPALRCGGTAAVARASRQYASARTAAGRRFPRLQPRLLHIRIERAADRLERVARRKEQALGRGTAARRARFERLAGRLSLQPVARRLADRRDRLAELTARLPQCFEAGLAQRRQMVAAQAQMLTALGYQGVLRRGFALVRDEAGRAVRSVKGLTPGQRLDVELADGNAVAEVVAGPVAAGRCDRGGPGKGHARSHAWQQQAEKTGPEVRARSLNDGMQRPHAWSRIVNPAPLLILECNSALAKRPRTM